MKLFLFGPRANINILAYEAYSRYWGTKIEFVSDYKTSDAIVVSSARDLPYLYGHLKGFEPNNLRVPIIIISEEPYWDYHDDPEPKADAGTIEYGNSSLRVRRINHSNSDVFNWSHVPYFLTTDERFLSRYVKCFNETLQLSATKLLSRWHNCDYRSIWMAERRPMLNHEVENKSGIAHLAGFRQKVMEELSASKRHCVRGRGWDTSTHRTTLDDWHHQKIEENSGRAMLIGAVENSVCKKYVTEKVFDALACQSIPVISDKQIGALSTVYSGPAVELALSSSISLVDEFEPDLNDAEQYLSALAQLKKRFSDTESLDDEKAQRADMLVEVIGQRIELIND